MELFTQTRILILTSTIWVQLKNHSYWPFHSIYLLIQYEWKIAARVYFQVLNFGNRNLSGYREFSSSNSTRFSFAFLLTKLSLRKFVCCWLFTSRLFEEWNFWLRTFRNNFFLCQEVRNNISALKDLSSDFTSHNMYPFGLTGIQIRFRMELCCPVWMEIICRLWKSLTHKYAQRARKYEEQLLP